MFSRRQPCCCHCSEDSSDAPSPGPGEVQYIKASMASCSFRGVDAGPLRIEVSTSPAAWNAEPSATWIRIVERTDNALLLTVDDNMSAAERTGEVTITAGQAEQSMQKSYR